MAKESAPKQMDQLAGDPVGRAKEHSWGDYCPFPTPALICLPDKLNCLDPKLIIRLQHLPANGMGASTKPRVIVFYGTTEHERRIDMVCETEEECRKMIDDILTKVNGSFCKE